MTPKILKIDDQIMETLSLSGRKTSPIRLFKRQHHSSLNLNRLPLETAG